MDTRNCAKCAKEKPVEGGMVCEKGHFICKKCNTIPHVLTKDDHITKCPLCKARLR